MEENMRERNGYTKGFPELLFRFSPSIWLVRIRPISNSVLGLSSGYLDAELRDCIVMDGI
jgi:hypothetical protein